MFNVAVVGSDQDLESSFVVSLKSLCVVLS